MSAKQGSPLDSPPLDGRIAAGLHGAAKPPLLGHDVHVLGGHKDGLAKPSAALGAAPDSQVEPVLTPALTQPTAVLVVPPRLRVFHVGGVGEVARANQAGYGEVVRIGHF